MHNSGRKDVRADIARVASVSTGNVTKVKQLLGTACPKVRESLRRGEVSIHRAWQWRRLSAKQQRDALWKLRNQKEISRTIRSLIAHHVGTQRVDLEVARLLEMLGELATSETTVVVADIPGDAIVFTKDRYEGLLRRKANDPLGHTAA